MVTPGIRSSAVTMTVPTRRDGRTRILTTRLSDQWEWRKTRPAMGRPGAHYDLARLLAPFDVDAFKREHWEKSPRIIRRDDRLYYRELLSFEGIDEILSTS